MIRVREPHLTSAQVFTDVLHAHEYKCEVSDAAAVTIASWWQSPHNTGFSKLASGLEVSQEEIARDIVREYHPNLNYPDRMALDMLGTWAIAKSAADG